MIATYGELLRLKRQKAGHASAERKRRLRAKGLCWECGKEPAGSRGLGISCSARRERHRGERDARLARFVGYR